MALLAERGTVLAFRELTAHVESAGYGYDPVTGCMAPVERIERPRG